MLRGLEDKRLGTRYELDTHTHTHTHTHRTPHDGACYIAFVPVIPYKDMTSPMARGRMRWTTTTSGWLVWWMQSLTPTIYLICSLTFTLCLSGRWVLIWAWPGVQLATVSSVRPQSRRVGSEVAAFARDTSRNVVHHDVMGAAEG